MIHFSLSFTEPDEGLLSGELPIAWTTGASSSEEKLNGFVKPPRNFISASKSAPKTPKLQKHCNPHSASKATGPSSCRREISLLTNWPSDLAKAQPSPPRTPAASLLRRHTPHGSPLNGVIWPMMVSGAGVTVTQSSRDDIASSSPKLTSVGFKSFSRGRPSAALNSRNARVTCFLSKVSWFRFVEMDLAGLHANNSGSSTKGTSSRDSCAC